MNRILIIDYGMGNLRSVQKSLERVGCYTMISSKPEDINSADKLIFPGVGHFKKGIENLIDLKLIDSLSEAVLVNKRPILGICLGMQLMTSFSEEGNCNGLNWIEAQTLKFNFPNLNLKIPHMGWNNLSFVKKNDIIDGITKDDFYYFVHSYNIQCKNDSDVVAKTHYVIDFVSIFNKGNIYGCQFHPEKSHDAGIKILKNFINT